MTHPLLQLVPEPAPSFKEVDVQVLYPASAALTRAARFAANFASAIGHRRVVVSVADSDQRARHHISRTIMTEVVQSLPLDVPSFSSPDGRIPLLVTNEPTKNELVLRPKDEEQFGDGPIVVPFGDGVTSLRSAQFAAQIAAKAERELIFCHATWQKSGLDRSHPAERHMCHGAEETYGRLRAIAEAHRAEYQLVAGMPTDVESFVIMIALRHRACLIVTARGKQKIRDHYACRIESESPTPVLTV